MVAHRNVGMANAGGDKPDQHFIGARLGERDLLEAERGILGARDRGGNLHGRFLPGSTFRKCLPFRRWAAVKSRSAPATNNNCSEPDNFHAWSGGRAEPK